MQLLSFYSCQGSRTRKCLAVHIRACLRERACVRKETSSSLRHELESSLFLSTGKHPAVVQPLRESSSALPRQGSDRPNVNLRPHKKELCDFLVSFRQSSENALSQIDRRPADALPCALVTAIHGRDHETSSIAFD